MRGASARPPGRLPVNDRLYRSRSDRMLAGVAGGPAEHFDVDPSIVRVVWVLLALVTGASSSLPTSSWRSSFPRTRSTTLPGRRRTGRRRHRAPAARRRSPRCIEPGPERDGRRLDHRAGCGSDPSPGPGTAPGGAARAPGAAAHRVRRPGDRARPAGRPRAGERPVERSASPAGGATGRSVGLRRRGDRRHRPHRYRLVFPRPDDGPRPAPRTVLAGAPRDRGGDPHHRLGPAGGPEA